MLKFQTLTRCRQLLAPIDGDRDRQIGTVHAAAGVLHTQPHRCTDDLTSSAPVLGPSSMGEQLVARKSAPLPVFCIT